MADVLDLLGLAYRARKVVLGEMVLKKIRNVRLLFLASDISPKSKERFLKKCHYYQIAWIDSYSTDELSMALGKNNVRVIGITDDGFRQAILKKH